MSEPSVQSLFDLTGRAALITGGSGHLGQALARALAEAGASVVIGSRERERADLVAETLPVSGDARHYGVELDQLDEQTRVDGFNDAIAQAGKLDILVNNGQQGHAMDWSDVTSDAFSKDLQNATGYFMLARQMRNHLVERHAAGSIVMIGSMYGVVGSYPDAYEDVCVSSPVQYHTLKGGIIHMTRHLAVYWAKDNVRVNCLSPGPFPSSKAPQEMVSRLIQKSPMKRMGVPSELKGPLMMFVSDAGSYVTGQNLVVDGGWTAW